MSDDPKPQPITVSGLIERLAYYNKEIMCNGTKTASHTYPSSVMIWDDQGNAYRIVEMEPRTHLGCGCWTGVDVCIERVADWSVND